MYGEMKRYRKYESKNTSRGGRGGGCTSSPIIFGEN
jgi:hypothetical protein